MSKARSAARRATDQHNGIVTEASDTMSNTTAEINSFVEQTRKLLPHVLIIDSVQMIYKADLDAAPGSIAFIRNRKAPNAIR